MSTPFVGGGSAVIEGRGASGIHSRIEADRKAANSDWTALKKFRAYALGKQKGTLSITQQRILRGVTGNTFCDNVVKMVLLAATGRLSVARFSVPDDAVQAWLDDFWTTGGLAVLANQVHWATLRDGDHGVALSWDNEAGRVRLARERWWDGKAGIFVAYDEWDRPVYAVKEWQATEGLRRVVWYPDRIERYVAQGNGWRPFRISAEEDSWQSEWTDPQTGEALGLPVVHFRNAYMPNDQPDEKSDASSSYGVSELDGGVLGLQDEINDVQRDITSAGRYTGYQMLYATGVEPERDANGKAIPIRVEPGAVFQSGNAQASYGTLPAGELGQLEMALHIKLQAVSRMTATPLHEITGGDWPSGEALMRSDIPLKDKADNMIGVFAPTWGSLAHKATVLANAFGRLSLDTDEMITMEYKPTDKSDPFTMARIAQATSKFVSKEESLRQLGKSESEIGKIMEERRADAERAQPVAPGAKSDTNPGNNEQRGQQNGSQNDPGASDGIVGSDGKGGGRQ